MPAFPGTQYTLSTRWLWAIFQTSACSRPFPPTTKTFILFLSRFGQECTGKESLRMLKWMQAIYDVPWPLEFEETEVRKSHVHKQK
jgi:hypothetical protein